MGRPTHEERKERGIERTFQDLQSRITDASAGRLMLKEMVFSRLVAEEGYTYSDAYVESFQPQSANQDSIYQMASRLAARPRVKAEIERIKRDLTEDAMQREKRLAIALDGEKVRSRMAIELFSVATSDADLKLRLKCWDLLGSMKHVDAFVTSNNSEQKAGANGFGVRPDQNAGEAKAAITESLRRLMGSRVTQKVIDTVPEIIEIKEENQLDAGK